MTLLIRSLLAYTSHVDDLEQLTNAALKSHACDPDNPNFLSDKLHNRNLLHKTYKLYMVSLSFQLSHLVMIICYYCIIADSGQDRTGIKLLGE